MNIKEALTLALPHQVEIFLDMGIIRIEGTGIYTKFVEYPDSLDDLPHAIKSIVEKMKTESWN